MIQAIGCTHDLGHPPFGHGGEVALNYCMRDIGSEKRGGFEGNGQTLRILARIESFSKNAGANLSRRTLLGVLKYPVAYSNARNATLVPRLIDGPSTLRLIDAKASKPPKCYMDSEDDVVSWILDPLSLGDRDAFQEFAQKDSEHNKPKHKSLDCSIMDAADDIAYGVHDLEDAVALRLITEARFREAVQEESCGCFLDALKAKYPSESDNNVYSRMIDSLFGDSGSRKHVISRLVHHFVTAMEYVEYEQFVEPIVRYRARMRAPQRKFLAPRCLTWVETCSHR
jgi:dGTPase